MSIEENKENRGRVRRCHATILFSDICGSTHLAELCDPEGLAEILSAVRDTAERVISKNKGVINQFYGDGVLAAFGFPTPQEGDVLHAAEAAIELHAAIESLSLQHYLPKSFSLRLHTGVHAGLVVVEEGDRVQGRYKLYGDALNTAARLSDAASPGEIISSESTLRGVLPFFETKQLEPLQLKGKANAINAYKILGRSDVNTRYEASVRRGLSPFVGRQQELGRLKQLLQVAHSGKLQLANIIGTAGLGKTRLVEQFIEQSQQQCEVYPCGVYRTYCQRDSSAVPLQPFVQLLQQLLPFEQGLTTAATVKALEQQLANADEQLLLFAPHFLQLLSLSDTSNDETAMQYQPQQLVQAFARLFSVFAAQQTLLIFIDDWHWADNTSRQVLRELVSLIQGNPVLIVFASRTLALSDSLLAAEKHYLEPFNLHDSTQTIAALFQHQMDLSVASAIFERSGGNALFIEELCQSVLAENKNNSDQALLGIPVTLYGLIEARVERLSEEHATLVRVAAVIGNIIPQWLFERVIGYRLAEDLLLELAHQDLLYVAENEGMMRFKHGLTRDVVYQSVRLQERQVLHQRVAQILEQETQKQGVDDQHEMLAYHYAGAADHEKTIHHAEIAGDKAMAAMALDRARMQYRAALEALDAIEAMTDNVACDYHRWSSIAQRYGWSCVFDPSPDQLVLLKRAGEIARQQGDAESIARAEYWLGYINYSLGQSSSAIYHCEQSLVIAKTLNDDVLAMHVLSTLAQAKSSACDYDGALADFNQAINVKRLHRKQAKPSVSSAYSLACKAIVLADKGLFCESRDCFNEAKLAVSGADSEIEGSVLALYSAACLWQGRWQDGVDSAIAAQQVAKKITSSYIFAMGSAMQAYANWMSKAEPNALQQMMDASAWLESQNKTLFISLSYGWLADTMVAQGDINGARHQVAHALMRVRQRDRLGEAMAYRAMAAGVSGTRTRGSGTITSRVSGTITSSEARVSGTEAYKSSHYYLGLAMSSAEVRGSRHEKAVTLLHQARLEGELGRCAEALPLLEQASREFEAMAMCWHFDQTEQLYLRFQHQPSQADVEPPDGVVS